MNIGLFGGTFNPVHNGHIQIARIAARKFNLNKVFFIVANIPPHKLNEEIIPATHRLQMVKHAIKNIKNFFTGNIELKRKNISYSYYTIKYYACKFPLANLFYIIGSDEFNILPTWYKIDNIFKLTHFIVVNRDKLKIPHPTDKLLLQNMSKIHLLNIKPIHICSTYIRKFIWRKNSVWNLLPRSVSSYIKKHLLYL